LKPQPGPQQPSSSSIEPAAPSSQPERSWDNETGEAEGEDQEGTGDTLPTEAYIAAEKNVRYALSALQHMDRNTAIDNLLKALKTLRS
uniref:Vta1_C domain-containing protein n=1 Tax=Echinostoma caproni TaxID=27848 RepID=A0A183BEB2_9TREM